MKFEDLLVRFLKWRLKHINDRNFVLILAILIGLLSGLAAVVLKQSVHLIERTLISSFTTTNAFYYSLMFPLVGITLTAVMAKYLLKERLGHGITQLLYDISKKSSIVRASKTYSRIVTSACTVGFGGSVGLEAPIVVTGSAIGSNVGRITHLGYRKRTLLIGCGAAGAISAIFNSPIAGVIFSLEIILSEVALISLIPLLISSVCASLVSLTLLGPEVLFSFKLKDEFLAQDVPYYVLLGVVCGLVSVYFTRMTYLIEHYIGIIKHDIGRAVTGGLLLGLIIFIFPPIYGEGYDTIKALLVEDTDTILELSMFKGRGDNIFFILLFGLGVLLIKPVASALTIGAGGSGGIFAPSLFLGAVTGFLYADTLGLLDSNLVSISNFTLVGMCGVMSGVLRAPLTAIFLIAEITSGYELFIPLMLVSAISFSTSLFFEKHSLYTKNLVESGDLIQYDKDRQVLSNIRLKKIIESDLLTIKPEAKLDELVNLVRRSKRNIFPVVNDEQELMGIITLDDVREIMFDEEMRQTVEVQTIMHSPPAFVSSHENMQSVMRKFELTGAWNLPVIDEGKYQGFVSKSRIFNTYRTQLIRAHRE